MEGRTRTAKLRPRNGTPAWKRAPRHPVSLRPTAGEGPAVRCSRPGVPSPLEGCPARVPAPVTRRAASPPPHPVWYLHLSHICKLLSCPRLVTAEPSATDLAPLIFPPKSILYFPLIIPWLLSELSLLPRLLQANACLSATAPPPTQNGGPKGMVNIWGGGLDFQHCLPPTWGAKARKCTHPLPFWKTHSTLNLLHPRGLCPPPAFPPPFIWDGSKTLSLHHDLQKRKEPKKTILRPPGCPHPPCPAALRRCHCRESLEGQGNTENSPA